MESKAKTDPSPYPLAAFETDDATMANALMGVGNDSSSAPSSSSHVHNPILTYANENLSVWTRGGGPGSIRPNTNGALSPLASPILSPVLSSTENPMMMMQINDEIIDINNDCVDSVGTSESVMEKIAVAFGSSNNLQQMIDQTLLGEESLGNEYEPPTNRQRIRSHSITIKSERRLSQSLGSQGMASAAAAVANSSRFSPSDDRFSPGLFSIGSSKPKLKPNSSAPALGGYRRTLPSHTGGITYSDSAGSLQSEDTAGTISPPIFIGGVNDMSGNPMRMDGSTNAAAGGVTSFDTTTTLTAAKKKITSAKPKPADKRQRRLERNRESARESRRRRKHYLEELESRVTGLSQEMDRGRMAHAHAAVRTLREMRIVVLDDAVGQLLHGNHPPSSLDKAANALVTHLSRTSTELQVVQTFMRQHLLNLVQPPSNRFVLWLSLQDDAFYRGGRSASERLSAARIGERLLQGGTDRVSPSTTMMWPLVCHEISISYEQEEKVRGMQRTILSNADGWIHRHTALATRKVIEGVHDVVCGSQAAAGERERNLMRILTPEQSLKYMGWTKRRADLIKRLAERKARVGRGAVAAYAGSCNAETGNCSDGEYKISSDSHLSANLYIINHILSKVLLRQQQEQQRCGTNSSATVSIPTTKLRKLGRRPSYESLAGLQAAEDAAKSKKSSPEESHLSTGSLKRSLTSMTSLVGDSYNDSNNDLNAMSSIAITLETAQIAGQAAVISVLRDVLPIVPKEAWYHPPSGAIVQPLTMTAVPSSSEPQAARKPKSSQQIQLLQKVKPRPAHPQQSQPSQFDIPDVDNIPMPTPVSELLRTSDDYLVPPEAYERQEPLVVHNSNGFTSLPIGYASRHRSAPQLEAFSHSSNDTYPSFMPSQKMASIPEMDVLTSHNNTVVAQVNHHGRDFAMPEQINSHSSYTSQQLGHRHQSAPQFDTVSIMTMMPEIDYTVPDSDFAMLEEFDFSSQLPGMDADDWAIGEGFEMDVEGSPRNNNFVH